MSKKRGKLKPDAWMPVFIGDFLAGTSHLSTELRGAYLLLLFAMWKGGARLLNDDEQLATITGLGLKRWRAAKIKLMPFFLVEDLYLSQKRLTEEYDHAWSVYGKRVSSGKKGGRPPSNDLFSGVENETERYPERGAERSPVSPPQSQSQSQSQDSSNNDASGSNVRELTSDRARRQLEQQASKALAEAGVECTTLDPHLAAALDAGIKPEALVALANSSKGKGKGIAYLSKTAIGKLADAATAAPAAPVAKPISPEKQATEDAVKKIEAAMYDDRHYFTVSGSIDKDEFNRRTESNKAALRELLGQDA